MTRLLMVSVGLALVAGCLDPGDPGNLVPRTVTEDPSLPQIEVAGTHLHAEAFGDPGAPTVMVLHGGPGQDYRSLLPLKALAADGYRVVFWDQRGTGLSQRHDAGIYSFPLYLEDLRLVVEKMATPDQPFVFIGHSWGAMYATWFINEYGDQGGRLRGAILSDPGAFTTKQLEAFLDRLEASVDLQGEQLNDALWSGQFMSAQDHARADYMHLMFSLRGAPSEHKSRVNPPPLWRGGAVVNHRLLALARNPGFDFTTRLESFGHKVLFLRAENNPAAPLEQQQELASSYAQAEVITLPGTGHEMVWDAPEAYLAHARTYFKAIGFVGVGR